MQNHCCTGQYRLISSTGTYPLKPSLPAVGGNEGVGDVIETGKDVQNLNTGDQVILRADQCLGKVMKMCHKNSILGGSK